MSVLSTSDEELLRRLPLPLAQLYRRARNGKTPVDRHHNAYYLAEAMLKLAASARIGVALSAGLDSRSPLARSLEQLCLPSVGHWVGFLRESSEYLQARPDGALLPLASDHGALTRHEAFPAVGEFAQRASRSVGGEQPPIAPEAAREAARRGVLGFFELVANYRNQVFGHGAQRPSAFYDELGSLLLSASVDILRQEVLFGGLILAVARLTSGNSAPSLRLEWQGLQGLASLMLPIESVGPEPDASEEAARKGAGLVYFLARGVRVPLHPLVVYREDRNERERVGFLNRTLEASRSGQGREVRRCDYLDYATGDLIQEVDARRQLTELLAKLRGQPTTASDVERVILQSQAGSDETAPARSLDAGAIIGDFVLEGELGRGGMGVVYRARQRSLNRAVALKVLPPSMAADPVSLGRFRREIAALARCEHPNLVKILTSGSDGDRHYYAMELIDGMDLAALFEVLAAWNRAAHGRLHESHLPAAVSTSSDMARRRQESHSNSTEPLPALQPIIPEPPPNLESGRSFFEALGDLFADAADALAHLHSRGVIHRDIKPANLMLTADGRRLVVMDLGLAQLRDRSQSLTADGTKFVGTLRYTSPEQLQRNLLEVDERADVYGLGAALYEMATLAPIFDGDTTNRLVEQVLHQEPRAPRGIEPAIPRDLAAIAVHCLEKDRSQRYANARDLAEDLGRFVNGRPVSVRESGPAERLVKWARRRPGLAALILLAAASTVTSFFLMASTISSLRREARVLKTREIVRRIEDFRDTSNWSQSQLRQIDAQTQVLSQLDPEAAATERRRTTQAFAKFLDGLIHNPEPIGPQLARIEAHLNDLKARDASLIPPLEKALGERISRPEPAFVVDADRFRESFARSADLFEPGTVRVEDRTLARTTDGPAAPMVLTRVECRGDVEFFAEFDHSWLEAPAVGLVLNAEDHHRYLFLIGDPSPSTELPPRAGTRRAWIFRDNTVLARGTVAIPAGSLKVEARRQGARLTLRVGDVNVLDFVDPYPLAIRDTGHFGVYWPPGVRLVRLSGLRQARPSDPAPVERGDDLFREAKYDQAVEFYRAQVNHSGAETEVGREARFKQAMSLAAMQDDSGAIEILRTLASEAALNTASPWPTRAAAQLALMYLQRKDRRAANEILETLAAGENAERLITLMPAEARDTILGYYTSSFGDWHNAIWYQQSTAERRSRALAIHKLLGSDPATIRSIQWGVIDDLRLAGDRAGALRGIEALLSEPDLTPPERIAYLRDFTWLSIEAGDVRPALEMLDPLIAAGEQRGEYLPLLVERARALAALGRWEEAARDSGAYLAKVDRSKTAYAEFADASLARGMILDQLGDETGALTVWRAGLRRNWSGVAPPSPIPGVEVRNRTNSYNFSLMLMSLTGEVTGDEALGAFEEMILANQSNEKVVSIAANAIKLPLVRGLLARELQPVFLETYASAEGKQLVGKVALRQLPLRDHILEPFTLCLATAIRLGAVDSRHSYDKEPLSPEISELIQLAPKGLIAGFLRGQLKEEQIGGILKLWLGLVFFNADGEWRPVAEQLDPDLRLSVAYGLGRRSLKLGRSGNARFFFQDVISRAKPGDLRFELSQAELEHLRKP